MIRSFSPSSKPDQNELFEEYVRDGINAARNGERALAERLLNRARMLHPTDARPWLWLTATTDDPQQQLTYINQAVAADPANMAAIRALRMIKGEWQPAPQSAPQPALTQPLEAQAQNFICPQCGGRMQFNIQKQDLTCNYCGYVQTAGKRLAVDNAETALGMVLPTAQAHRWAQSQHRLACERCGAITFLAPGQKTDRCPYCGYNRMITSAETAELIDPHSVALPAVDENEAYKRFRAWLGKGLLAPDDLTDRAGKLRLKPSYLPFWTFDGTLEIPWRCEINEGDNRNPRWVPHTGAEFEFFDDVLVPGVKAQPIEEIRAIEPFNLKDLVEFMPEYLAGWITLSYDRSMSDGSLVARDRVMRRIRQTLAMSIGDGRPVRNLGFGAGKWSGLTFKHILLPMWVGVYQYQGKDFRVLINAQTGKVGGVKPRDNIKLALWLVMAGLAGLGIMALLAWLMMNIPR
jgi:DNA-directed RNA polymerase subunit RPC12/RpoP